MSSFIAVNYKEVEYHMDTNEVPLLVKELKFYRRNRLWKDLIGYKYCHGKCRFLHELVRRSKGDTVVQVLQLLDKMIGRVKLVRELTLALDASGRSVLIVGTKHLDSSILVDIIEKYDLDVHLYSVICKMSILSYALKRKKHDLILTCLKRINARRYTKEQLSYYNRDLELLRTYIEERTSVDLPLFESLTEEYGGGKRMYKVTPPVPRSPRSFKQSRAWQLLRHVATQLYFRWKYFLKVRDLEDVQILCCERKEDPYWKPMLFVACTPCSVSRLIEDDFIAGPLYTMLTATYVSDKDEVYTTDKSDEDKEGDSDQESGRGSGGKADDQEKGEENKTEKGNVAGVREVTIKTAGKEKGEAEETEKEGKTKDEEQVKKKQKKVKIQLSEDEKEMKKKQTEEEEEDDIVETLSHRMGSKLRSRVWGKHRQNYSSKHSKDICQVLMRDIRTIQQVRFDHKEKNASLPQFNNKEGRIYLVNTTHTNKSTPMPIMHAEFILCGIANHLKETTKDIITTIYGKGRPCVACSSPLRASKIDHFNERQGLLSADGVHVLQNNVRLDCVASLFERPSHISQMIKKKDEDNQVMVHLPDYDSLSDSEPDESTRSGNKVISETRKRISQLNVRYKIQMVISDSYTQTTEENSWHTFSDSKKIPPCSLTSPATTIWLCPSSKSIRDAKMQTVRKKAKKSLHPQQQHARKSPVFSTSDQFYGLQNRSERRYGTLDDIVVTPSAPSASTIISRGSDRRVGEVAHNASYIISTSERKYGTKRRLSSASNKLIEDKLIEQKTIDKQIAVEIKHEILRVPVTQPIRKRSAPSSSSLRPLFQSGDQKRCPSAPLLERKKEPTPTPFTQRSELPESCISDLYDVFYM